MWLCLGCGGVDGDWEGGLEQGLEEWGGGIWGGEYQASVSLREHACVSSRGA